MVEPGMSVWLPSGAITVNVAASPITSPPPIAPPSVSCTPFERSPSASNAGVIVEPGVGCAIAQVGATVSTRTLEVADADDEPVVGSWQTARSEVRPSASVSGKVALPSGADMVPAEVSCPLGPVTNSSLVQPDAVITITVDWNPAVAGSGSAAAFRTWSGA